MRRETFVTVEGILRSFPQICESLNNREQYLSSLVHNSFNTFPLVDGGDHLSAPERATDFKIRDVEYCELMHIVDRIGDALRELPDELFSIIWSYYFSEKLDIEIADELNYSESWVKKIRLRAIRIMVEPCLNVHLVVERWRRREKQRQIAIITKLLKCG